MTGTQALTTNGDNTKQEVRDELDQIVRVLDSSDANELLELVNAGLGNYDEDMLFQQQESYRKGLVVHTAFASLLMDRAIDQTKQALARQGIDFYDEQGTVDKHYDPLDEDDIPDDRSRWNKEREYGEKIWKRLGKADEAITKKQASAIIKTTGVDPAQWIPMFWDMFVGKHEMSRSLDAELIRLYLGDHYTVDDNSEAEGTTQSLLRRR